MKSIQYIIHKNNLFNKHFFSFLLVITFLFIHQNFFGQYRALANPSLEFGQAAGTYSQHDANFGFGATFDAGSVVTSPWYTSHPTQANACTSGGVGDCHPIEVWNAYNGVTAAQGSNFVELNAYVSSMIYQNLYLRPGDVVSYNFNHRARAQATERAALVIENQSAQNVATIYSTGTSSSTTQWSNNSGNYTVPAGVAAGIYRVGFRALVNGGSEGLGNFIDNSRITLNPIIDLKSSTPGSGCEGTNVGRLFLRINGAVSSSTTVAVQLVNPNNGSAFISDSDINLVGVANNNGTPTISHTAGSSVYLITIPAGNYDGGITAGYASPNNDEDGVAINVNAVIDGVQESAETFRFTILQQGTNGSSNNFDSTATPVFGDTYYPNTGDYFIKCGDVLGCNTTMYLSQTNRLYTVNTSVSPLTYPAVGAASTSNYNALASNPVDGILYAILQDTNTPIAFNSNGTYATMAAVTNLPNGVFYNAGEIDHLGNYYVKANGAGNILYRINLNTMVASTITLSSSIALADLAYNTSNNLLYSVNTANGQLLTINPSNGNVTTIGTAGSAVTFGAMFGSSTGEVYGADNAGGFYQFNLTNGQRTLISNSPTTTLNDGAHCVTSPVVFSSELSVTKTDNSNTYIAGTNSTYTVVVSNSGPYRANSVSVSDPLPTGIAAANVSYTATTSGGATTSVSGTQTGAISDVVNLPSGGSVTYTVVISVPFSYSGNVVNTASLTIPSNVSDGNSTNNSATDTNTQAVCYRPGNNTGTVLNSQHGITSLSRAGNDASGSNWPMVRKGAWTVLESKTKGFVLNRLTNDQIAAIPSANLVEGMMVYNIDLNCLQVNITGTATGWTCFNTQNCPSN